MKPRIATLAPLILAVMAGCSKSEPTAPTAAPAAPATEVQPEARPAPPPAHHDEHGAAQPAAPAPGSLREAVAKLDVAYQELAAIVKDGDLSEAHHVADQLRTVGDSLPGLAQAAGLPAEDIKALTLAGKKLGLLFRDMDEAGDAGNREESQKVFARYEEPMTTIKTKTSGVK